MNKYSELLKLSIRASEWNEKYLPLNTEDMQYDKIKEESNEVIDAIKKMDKEQEKMEKADVFIAISGLIRFNIEGYFDKMSLFFSLIDFNDYSISEFINNIENKLEIIKHRHYEIVNGVYHSVKEH